MIAGTPASRAMSKLRVIRATLIAAGECVEDLRGDPPDPTAVGEALEFLERGKQKVADARAEIEQALIDAGARLVPKRKRRKRST